MVVSIIMSTDYNRGSMEQSTTERSDSDCNHPDSGICKYEDVSGNSIHSTEWICSLCGAILEDSRVGQIIAFVRDRGDN